jgi:hypothetical protein
LERTVGKIEPQAGPPVQALRNEENSTCFGSISTGSTSPNAAEQKPARSGETLALDFASEAEFL